MSFTAALLQKLTVSGGEVTPETIPTFSGDAKDQREIVVTNDLTDFQVVIGIDVSAIQAIMIVSDQNVTMETNDGLSPNDTINLLADNPYIWYTGSYFTNVLTTDITDLFFTNSSGETATVKLLVIYDSTPT